ncbi:MAG: LysE family transporter [Candidatus Hydrogenedens sp.]|nr:LysE family transporter [Candidatus Hydrogenedens sp.]
MISIMVTGIFLGLSSGLSPGPLMTLVIGKSLQHGPREGIKMALAPVITDCAIIILSLLLFHSLAHLKPLLLLLSFCGALLLLYLARENWCNPLPDTATLSEKQHSLLEGALVNVLSPHPWLFWFTIGAPVLYTAWKQQPAQAFLFLSSFYLFLIGSKVVTALSFGIYGRFLQDKYRIIIMRVLSCVLVFFAVLLLWKGWTQL